MSKIILLTALLVAGAALAQQLPGQPYASYWFPDELLTWSPGTDPDAPYNRSFVELSDRSWGDTQCNAHATDDQGGVGALSIMYPSTSGNPSQGGTGIDTYAFGYWQYVDHLTFWGGSAGEGLILAPNPGVIDAAHRNGVPVYGTIFFPPTAYGGQIGWVWDFVQKEGNSFPVADALIEMTEHYGFDGWFINQETAGGNAQLAQDMRDLMLYVQENSDLHIQWYDAMTEGGDIVWQNALNTANDWYFEHEGRLVSEWMFLNFWWNAGRLESSADHARSLGRSPYELYAGVDVQANGYNTSVSWDAVFPEGEDHVTSLGFYCPNWTYSSSSGHLDFYERASRFWCGANRDPSNTETTHPWKGLAHYYAARTPITSFPFVSCFNTGQGYLTAVDGEVLSGMDWHNRGQQDVLPTWRWIAESPGTPLYPELCWDSAYDGGSCLRVSGDLSPGAGTMLYLYKTDASIEAADTLLVAWHADSAGQPSGMRVFYSLDYAPDVPVYSDIPSSTSAGWNVSRHPLAPHAGSTMALMGLDFNSSTSMPDYEALIGMMGVVRGTVDVPEPPSGLYVESFDQVSDTLGTVRLRWDHSPSEVRTYNVYRDDGDGRTFLWATPGNACFVPRLTRELSQDESTVLVEAVSPELGRSQTVSVTVEWETTGIEGPAGGGGPLLAPVASNPVTGPVELRFSLPVAGSVSLRAYDLSGRVTEQLLEAEMQAGEGTVPWDATALPAGIYILRLDCPSGTAVRRCLVL